MKKENMLKMIDLYLLSHQPKEDEFVESEGTKVIKDIIDSELDILYEVKG